MYPEDRVLVGVMPDPTDLEIANTRHWYRIPALRFPDGIHADYIAFYFTAHFDELCRWGIHYYARRTGHELARRIDLFPDQQNHPRAHETYYKIQLGTLRAKIPPIVSLRWRRITFIQTTWDRFTAAQEINDLFASDERFVNRIYKTLQIRGIQAEREVEIQRKGKPISVDLMIPCQKGSVLISNDVEVSADVLVLTGEIDKDVENIVSAVEKRGGPHMLDVSI